MLKLMRFVIIKEEKSSIKKLRRKCEENVKKIVRKDTM